MIFSTFHKSGVAQEFNVVDGVPRLEELIRITTKPKSPTLTIYLRGEHARDEVMT